MASRLRKQDLAEVYASAGCGALQALTSSLRVSRDPKAGLVNGEVVCMFGVGQTTLVSPIGIPWLLGTDELVKHARAFLRMSRAYMQEAHERHQFLVNFVDARNYQSIRWLKWLGFKIEPAAPFGYAQLPFHRFHMGEPYV